MLKFLRNKKNHEPDHRAPAAEAPPATAPSNPTWLQRLSQGLARTRQQFAVGLADLILGKKSIDTALLDDLEERLLSADVGIDACEQIIAGLTERVSRKQISEPAALLAALKQELLTLLQPVERPWQFNTQAKPHVILAVGVNGAGKTTTLGKLACRLQANNHQIMLAAGDTFRAAAIEQLQVWGERNRIPVIAQQQGADSASVIYDALAAAKARQIDILLADSAGRLHTQNHLMQELQKVVRVLKKLDADAPHDVFLVLDASMGQNALRQAQEFHAAINVTGLILTKLDGTAKGGIIFAIAKQLQLPIYFVGMGEGLEDLRPFVAEDFVNALFA